VVRRLEHVLADQARAEGDDRVVISRTEERREKQRIEAALFAVATQLIAFKPRQLEQLGLTEAQLEVIDEIRVIDNPSAQNRALKHLRAELRDEDLGALQKRIAALTDPQARHRPDPISDWCDRLRTGGDAVLSTFVEQYPGADRAQLRAIIRNAVRAKAPEQARALTKLTQCVRTSMAKRSAAVAKPSAKSTP
jgi:ribosome-associated protein